MSMYESRAGRLRRTIERQGAKQAAESRKAGRGDESAGPKAAAAAKTMAKAQKDLHETEAKIRAKEARDEKRRRDQEQRDRQQAESARVRAERERERQDQARDSELRALNSQVANQEHRLREASLAAAPTEITVLFIAASPEDQEPLRLDREVREIQRRVRETEHRNSVVFEVRLATQLTDPVAGAKRASAARCSLFRPREPGGAGVRG